MTKEKKNTTVLSMTAEEGKEVDIGYLESNPISIDTDNIDFSGYLDSFSVQPPQISGTIPVEFKKDKKLEKLKDNFDSKDKTHIENIYNKSKKLTETPKETVGLSNILLENNVTVPDIHLIETTLQSELDSASKDNTQIIMMDGCLNLRKKDNVFSFSRSETNFLKRVLVSDKISKEYFGSSRIKESIEKTAAPRYLIEYEKSD